jgi:hypothetical protein
MRYKEEKEEWINSIKKSLIESMNNVCDDWDYQLDVIISPNTDEVEDERLEESMFQFRFNVSIVPDEFKWFVDTFCDSVLETCDRLEMTFHLKDFLIKRGTQTLSKKYANILKFNIDHEEYLTRWRESLIDQLKVSSNIIDVYPDVRGEVIINFSL